MRMLWRRRPALKLVGPTRGLPGEPDYAFGQAVGRFHQDLFEDGETLDEIIEGYRRSPAWLIRDALETGRRILGEGHDEKELEEILTHHGFCLVPEACGYAGHSAFLEHLVGRWEEFIAGLPPEAFVEPEIGR
jgi:hypothetical protein